ncbi:MAG TPA: aspartate-semialdehyde dehydrogenase [Thermoplasmata archaeon]|nr:aspartate-semialdehyde dehydrogenase [Thermoplasmata archaeon]
MSPTLRTAVLGAGGYIGQEFVRLLSDHPDFLPPVLVGGGQSIGRTLSEVWRLAEECPKDLARARITAPSPSQLARTVDVAFGAMPSGSAGPIESELSRRGVAVFSNAADHRLDPNRPMLVPEVNGAHLALLGRSRGGRAALVTNPNCSATGLVLALAPVLEIVKPIAVHVATYQSLSGAGFPGVPSLSVTDNVLPYIEEEEEKLALEAPRLLGRLSAGALRPLDVPFVAHCARVGVREGHLEAVTVEARGRPDLDALLGAWRSFDPLRTAKLPTAPHPPVVVRNETDRPQPLLDRWAGSGRARGMAAVVGRVRWRPPYLRFFVLSHNAVRGGAGGSVLNAEYALSRGYWGGGRS